VLFDRIDRHHEAGLLVLDVGDAEEPPVLVEQGDVEEHRVELGLGQGGSSAVGPVDG
jgi:hypothetical protein